MKKLPPWLARLFQTEDEKAPTMVFIHTEVTLPIGNLLTHTVKKPLYGTEWRVVEVNESDRTVTLSSILEV